MAKNPIECFTKHGRNDLQDKFDALVKSGKNEYEAAREILLAEHKGLYQKMETLTGAKKSTYTEPAFPAEKINSITKDYEEKINAERDSQNKQSQLEAKEKSKPTEPITEEGKGAEPPSPPVEAKGKTGEDGERKKKGVLTHLYEAKNIPEAAREGFKKEGLEYETKSQEEAYSVAKSIIDEYGIDEAVEMAEAQKFDGDVNSLLYAESLNRLKEQEDAAVSPEDKINLAKRFKEVGIMYDNAGRKGGRFNSAINHFYKKSPLGIVMIENEKRGKDFNNWSKPKEKSWQEFYDELMKEPEFDKIVKEQIKEELKKERAEARKSRKEKADKFFDDAIEKTKSGGTYVTVIPPNVMRAAINGMRKAYHAGEKVAELIQVAIDEISAAIGNAPWDKEKFRKEWESKMVEKPEKKPLTDEEVKVKILDKFRKKLKGLTEKQKDDVIRKSYKQLIENGALEFEDLRKIIAEVTGRGDLTLEEAAKMKELVAKTNELEKAAEKARTQRTDKAYIDFKKQEIETAKASRQLNEMFYNKPDIVKRLTSIMQLNTLGIVSLVNNPIYNIWNQATLRFPVGVINDLVDRSIAGAASLFGKEYQREYNIIGSQAEFWRMLGVGTKESFEQVRTGLNRADYTQKEVYTEQIRPLSSLRDLIAYSQGKKKLSKAQVMDKAIQATAGVPAEIVARILNIGDKPQRFAAEGAQAAAFAKSLGLKDMDYRLFVEFPREEAYRAYKAEGFSDAEAGQKADYVKEAVIKEGQRSTFQQDNLLNDAISAAAGLVFGGKDSGLAVLAKTITISPYIKIPSNAFWSFYNLLNPEIAILQSLTHGGRAKYFSNKNEPTKSKLALREARYWMAHAIVGMASRAVVLALVESGIFTPSSDDDDTKKKRDAISYFDRAGTTEIAGIKISNRWFGQWGMLANQISKKYYDATPEQRQNQDDFWNIVFGGMEREGLAELQNGVFSNSSALLQSLSSGDFGRWGMSNINMMANIVQPATLAQINRASLNEVPTSRGDNFLDRLNQNFAQRSWLYRWATDTKIDKKRDIWGQTIPKGGNVITRMFGISKANPQLFGRPLYEDFLKTKNTKFLPPAIDTDLHGKKLNKEQYDRLQEYVGSERKRIIEPYVNDMAVIPEYNQLYSKLDDNVKTDRLEYLYGLGRELGLEKFYKDYPSFRPKEKTDEQQEQDKVKRESNKKLRSKYILN